MTGLPGGWKLLYAFSLPAVLVACSIVGADDVADYRPIATAFVVAGGICAARLARPGDHRYGIAIAYMVAVEALLLCLP